MKASKRSVNYRRARIGAPRRCGTCSMFRAGGRCTLVSEAGPPHPGEIRRGDVCARWAPR